MSEVGRSSIESTYNVYNNEEFRYCFIRFNYTNIPDQIVNITHKWKLPISTHQGGGLIILNSLGKIAHIHGTLDHEMILGVNDIEQVNSTFLKNDAEFLDTFIKERVNNSIEHYRSVWHRLNRSM